MFRDVQSTVEVNAADGTLVSPVLTEKKEACFEKGREEWARPEKQQYHEEAERQITSAISDPFHGH